MSSKSQINFKYVQLITANKRLSGLLLEAIRFQLTPSANDAIKGRIWSLVITDDHWWSPTAEYNH